jgi:hypothetical protein
MAAPTAPEPPAPVEGDPDVRKALAIGAFAFVALPGLVSALSYATSDGFKGDEQAWLVSVRDFAMQTHPMLAELLKPFSQAVPALLVTAWFRRDTGRLSGVGWATVGVLLSCIGLGLLGSYVLEPDIANDISGGEDALAALQGFSQTTFQSAATYLFMLLGISQTGGAAK